MTDYTELLLRLDEWVGVGKVISDPLLQRDIATAAAAIRALQEQVTEYEELTEIRKAAGMRRGLKIERLEEQVKEYDNELNYLEWRNDSDGTVSEFAKHAGKSRKRIKAMAKE